MGQLHFYPITINLQLHDIWSITITKWEITITITITFYAPDVCADEVITTYQYSINYAEFLAYTP